MFLKSKQPSKLEASNKNKVTIRIWLPLSTLDTGHASLQTYYRGVENKGIYVSIWPESAIKASEIFKPKKAVCHTFEDDLSAERRKPEVTIDLFSLDVNAINKAYTEADLDSWVLVRTNSGNQQQNCSGLVMYLLSIGGSHNLVSKNESGFVDSVAGLAGGIVGGALTYPALVLGFTNPIMLGLLGSAAIGALVYRYYARNHAATLFVSPMDLAKYVLYAKKAEKQKYDYAIEEYTHVDLSKHKTWFNFTWIDESFYNKPSSVNASV